MFQKIKEGNFHFKHKEFQNVSDEGKDLISKLLEVSSERRLDAAKAV